MTSSTRLRTLKFLHEFERSIKDDLIHTDANKLSVNAVYVLNALYQRDGQRPSDLATAIGMTQTSFTPTIDMLERNGLTERRSNETDRRSILIYLLMDGKRLQKVIEAALANAEVRYGGG